MEAGGFLYLCDSYADDLPYWIKGPASEPHLIIPYTLDANDMRFVNPQGFGGGDEFFTYLKDSFDVLYAEGETSPKMMSIGLHCRVVGRPGRAAALDALPRLHRQARARLGADAAADRRALARQPEASRRTRRSTSDRQAMSRKLSDLNACSKDDFVAALGNIFEYSPWIAEQAAASGRSRASTAAVRRDEGGGRSRAPEMRLALIKAHPDLANKTQRAAGLTAESNAEQNSAGLDRLSDAEYEAFERVNNAYRVEIRLSLYRLRSPPHQGFHPARFRAAAAERCQDRNADIDRGDLPDRGAAARPARRRPTTSLPVHGRLSTHVLDTHSGKPAAGISVELIELSDLGESPRGGARGHQQRWPHRPAADRRPPGADRALRTDVSRRRLFCRRGVPMSDPPFLDQIPLRFSVSEPEGHLHVPLLVTPWSYATYRGS